MFFILKKFIFMNFLWKKTNFYMLEWKSTKSPLSAFILYHEKEPPHPFLPIITAKLILLKEIIEKMIFNGVFSFQDKSRLTLKKSINSHNTLIAMTWNENTFICGFIQKKRSQKIKGDLFIKRCLFRANMKILREIKSTT